MKKIIFIMAVLPLAAFAQKAQETKKELKAVTVHYEEGIVFNYEHRMLNNKPSKYKTETPGPGEIVFDKDEKNTAYLKYYTALEHPEYDYGKMTAQRVTISAANYPDLKGDKFVYDNLTDKAELSGHVTLVDNGIETPIAETAYLDFTDDNYKIEGLK